MWCGWCRAEAADRQPRWWTLPKWARAKAAGYAPIGTRTKTNDVRRNVGLDPQHLHLSYTMAVLRVAPRGCTCSTGVQSHTWPQILKTPATRTVLYNAMRQECGPACTVQYTMDWRQLLEFDSLLSFHLTQQQKLSWPLSTSGSVQLLTLLVALLLSVLFWIILLDQPHMNQFKALKFASHQNVYIYLWVILSPVRPFPFFALLIYFSSCSGCKIKIWEIDHLDITHYIW